MSVRQCLVLRPSSKSNLTEKPKKSLQKAQTSRVLKPELRRKNHVLLIHKCYPGSILHFPHFSLSLLPPLLPIPEGHYQTPKSSKQRKPSYQLSRSCHLQASVCAFQQQQCSQIHIKSINCGKGVQLLQTQLSAERCLQKQLKDSCPSTVAVATNREALHGHKPNKIHLGVSSYLLAYPVNNRILIP